MFKRGTNAFKHGLNMFKHGFNMFKHGFRQVLAIFQDPKIQKFEKLIKNQKTKVQDNYHDAEVGKAKKNHRVEPPKGIKNHEKSLKIEVKRSPGAPYIPL